MEPGHVRAEGLAPIRQAREERGHGRDGLAEAIPPGEAPSLPLGRHEPREVVRGLEGGVRVIAAAMGGHLRTAVQDPHGLGLGHEGERDPDQGVRD
jgi:hypothetical protein